MAVAAHFEPSSPARRQREPRRRLLFDAQGTPASGEATAVLVHNISATGVLLQCAAVLGADEMIEIDLPEAGATPARVVWTSGELYGCRFEQPISRAALSAAQLRSVAEGAMDLAAAPGATPAESFADKLKRLRKARGLTLAQIAAALEVSKPTVWAWEKGRAQPAAERIDALAAVLGVAAAELRFGSADLALHKLIARSREQIALACGTRPELVRIYIEL